MSTAPSFVPTIPLGDLEPHVAVEQIVGQAIQQQASDLFILSDEAAPGFSWRLRALIEPLAIVPREQGRHLINYFKTTAGMDIAERRRPQEGRWLLEQNGNRVDLRINVVPTL